MGFWKIIGGMAIGVGAIAAAPFTGGGSVLGATTLLASLSGAGTIAAAVAAATAGGVAASKISNSDKESGRKEGEKIATAKYQKKVEKLEVALFKALGTLEDDKGYFKLIVALFAVGMATANADGKISEEELIELNEFLTGAAHESLPAHINKIIAKLKATPPSFSEAMNYVNKLKNIDLSLFENVIQLISHSDGKVTKEETAFLAAFRLAVAA
jgi:hypothetical protein